MEQLYWLGRESASLKAAQNAVSARARLIHYELAGRYSLKALSSENRATDSDALAPAIYGSGGWDGGMVRSGG